MLPFVRLHRLDNGQPVWVSFGRVQTFHGISAGPDIPPTGSHVHMNTPPGPDTGTERRELRDTWTLAVQETPEEIAHLVDIGMVRVQRLLWTASDDPHRLPEADTRLQDPDTFDVPAAPL